MHEQHQYGDGVHCRGICHFTVLGTGAKVGIQHKC
jgi:hypothetical protein